MLVDDDLAASASSPNLLFQQLLAKAVRACAVSEVLRVDEECGWHRFMALHALALKALVALTSPLVIPCLCSSSFTLKHIDDGIEDHKNDNNVMYSIFSLPRVNAFVLVSSLRTWKCFGRGAQNLLSALQCTPAPDTFSIFVQLLQEPFASNALLNEWQPSSSSQTGGAVFMNQSFVHALVEARRAELGLVSKPGPPTS